MTALEKNPGRLLLASLLLGGCLAWPAGAQVQPQVPPPEALPQLRFADFFVAPMGGRGLQMAPALRQADGQRVALTGYMVQQERPSPGRFMLTPRPVRMSEHADGDADDLPAAWVMVYLDPSQQDFAVPYQRGLLELRGVASVGRVEENDGRVSWVRLHLGAEATQTMQAIEVTHYLNAQEHAH